MIFWNAVTYMDDAIRSVLDQTHRSLELLLCDDGSTDASTALARDWARRDTRVRYVDHVGHAHRGTVRRGTWGSRRRRGSSWPFSTPTTSGYRIISPVRWR
jgi:glycosyltransferase involved in cell wall biosynthesis